MSGGAGSGQADPSTTKAPTMEECGQPFRTFYAKHARNDKGKGRRTPLPIHPAAMARFEQETAAGENDKQQFRDDLQEVFWDCCDGSEHHLEQLSLLAGGADNLIRLYKIAGRDHALLGPLIDLWQDPFDCETEALSELAKAVGGAQALLEIAHEQQGIDHLRELLGTVPAKQFKALDADAVRSGAAVDDQEQSLIAAFEADPCDATARALVRIKRLLPGSILKVVQSPADEGYIAMLKVRGPLADRWIVEARCSGDEGPAATVAEVRLLGPAGAICVLGAELKIRFADANAIWLAWSNRRREEREPLLPTKARMAQVGFADLPDLDIRLAGKPSAYQTHGDKADSAVPMQRGMRCFSFSSGLAGPLASVWLLHAHCEETRLDDEGQCAAFKVKAASLKLATEDRMVESKSTMKVAAKEDTSKGGKGRSAQAQAVALFEKQRGRVLQLAASCQAAAVIRAWNVEKARLFAGASHATIYDRHNVADPIDDLVGWAKSMRNDRIQFLFFSRQGLATHLKALRDEIGRFVASGQAAQGADLEKHKQVAIDLMNALHKAAESSTKNEPIKGKVWEQFAFEVDLDFGPFGRFTLSRSADNTVEAGKAGPIEEAPTATMERIKRYVDRVLFASQADFTDAALLLQSEAAAIAAAAERLRSDQRDKLYQQLYYSVTELSDWITARAQRADFDFAAMVLGFGAIGSFTLSRNGGRIVARPAFARL